MHKFKNLNREKTEIEGFMERFHGLKFKVQSSEDGKIVEVETDDQTIIAWLEENGLVGV